MFIAETTHQEVSMKLCLLNPCGFHARLLPGSRRLQAGPKATQCVADRDQWLQSLGGAHR